MPTLMGAVSEKPLFRGGIHGSSGTTVFPHEKPPYRITGKGAISMSHDLIRLGQPFLEHFIEYSAIL